MSDSQVVAESVASGQRVIEEVESQAARAVLDRIPVGLSFRTGRLAGSVAVVQAVNGSSVELLTGTRLKQRSFMPLARVLEHLAHQTEYASQDGVL